MLHLTKRFEAAARALVGEGPIKQRLWEAYGRHLADLALPDLPDPLRDRFEQLHAALHRSPPMGKEGSLKVSVQKMSFAEAVAHAESILNLYAEVIRNADRTEPLKVVHSDEKPPRYLTGN